MKFRWYLIISFVALAVMCVAGIYTRTTMAELSNEELWNNAKVGVLDQTLANNVIERMSANLENENIILAVECVEEPDIIYKNVHQKVKVICCFKGDIDEGSEINILQVSSIFGFNEEGMLKTGSISDINLGYTNKFNVGDTYLVFLDREIEGYPVANTYVKSDEYLLKPFFNYKEIANKKIPVGKNIVAYSSYSDNEFFVTADGIDEINELKRKMLDKYRIIVSDKTNPA